MFTGLVEELGTVDDLVRNDDSARLRIRAGHVLADAHDGDSIAVNGCCLTVSERDHETFTADVMAQTLDLTGLGDLRIGDPVNLERAMQVGARLGGHLVQGHVDAVGTVVDRQPGDNWERVTVEVPAHLDRYLVAQGSITIDGVSLTVADLMPGRVTVSLIPETLKRTTLGRRDVGARVNLEVDVVAKYVEKMVGPHLAAGTSSTTEQQEQQ
ncbi:riboflavin synthase [Nocardioidaceae bacterium]|nr:riboflavin synthase [Nocardioidaceae bacterium]